MVASRQLWAVKWSQANRLHGRREHFMNEHCTPVLFTSRRAARDWITRTHGYIADRPDLRCEPHGWRVPQAVRVLVTVEAT